MIRQLQIFLVLTLVQIITQLGFSYDKIELNLGDQISLDFSQSKINYYVNFSGFQALNMKAGLCLYSTRLSSEKTQYMFNNTHYKLDSYTQIQIPFVKKQSSMNITLLEKNFKNSNQQQMQNKDQIFDTLNIQICGILTEKQEIPYVTKLNTNNQNMLYFFKNQQNNNNKLFRNVHATKQLFEDDKDLKNADIDDQEITQYRLSAEDLELDTPYMLNLNTIHLKSKKLGLFAKLKFKYNIIQYQEGSQSTENWNYPSVLSDGEEQQLQNIQDQNEKFLQTSMFQCTNIKKGYKCGLAITIFYVFPDNIGKFQSPFARINLTKVQTKPYKNIKLQENKIAQTYGKKMDGELENVFYDISDFTNAQAPIQGQFTQKQQFAHFQFTLNGKSSTFYQISQKSTGSQPAFQICEQNNDQTYSCSSMLYYFQKQINFSNKITQKTYYLVFSPSLSTGLLASKKQLFKFQISKGLVVFEDQKTLQYNFGNQNTFAVKNFAEKNAVNPSLEVSAVFLAINKQVPKTKIFENGSVTGMDQYITFCKEKDVNKCDFLAYKNPKSNAIFQNFEGLTPIIGAYVQTVSLPEDSITYAIVNQFLYVTPKINDDESVKQSRSDPIKYYEYVTQVSETVQNTIVIEEEGSNGWMIVLYISIGVLVIVGGVITYYCIRKHKKNSSDLQEQDYEEIDDDINNYNQDNNNGQSTAIENSQIPKSDQYNLKNKNINTVITSKSNDRTEIE